MKKILIALVLVFTFSETFAQFPPPTNPCSPYNYDELLTTIFTYTNGFNALLATRPGGFFLTLATLNYSHRNTSLLVESLIEPDICTIVP